MTSRDQLLNAQIATELQRSTLEMDPQDPHSRSGPKYMHVDAQIRQHN